MRFVVLTGGPGAGKTAVMEAAKQIFAREITILPEAASIVYSGGFPRYPTPNSVRAAQRAIAAVQTELESFSKGEGKAAITLCDRGIADGAAYWPGGAAAFFASINMPAAEVFARYSTVIHLRTPTAAMGYDNSNPMRTESAKEAAELDRRTERVWRGHPNRLVVPATETFTEKLEHLTALIRDELNLESPPKGKISAAPTIQVVRGFLN